jgi:2-iminobutanoate/2-iminopropanoate deaminase
MPKTKIVAENAPFVEGVPLSPGVRKGNILQVSGQIALDPATGQLAGDTVTAQTRQVMRNVIAVLQAGGASIDDAVMLRVYLTDTDHFAEMNAAYTEFLTEPLPARTTVYVGLPPGLLVEIDALAVLGD